MRNGFREIQRNFSNSAKKVGFCDYRGFRGIAENRQPYPYIRVGRAAGTPRTGNALNKMRSSSGKKVDY